MRQTVAGVWSPLRHMETCATTVLKKRRIPYLLLVLSFSLLIILQVSLTPTFSDRTLSDEKSADGGKGEESTTVLRASMIQYSEPVVKLLYSAIVTGQEPVKSSKLHRVENSLVSYVERAVASGAIPSAAMMISWNNSIDLEIGARLDHSTVVPLSSLTKSITAIAVMQLAEEGLIGLDDEIRKHGLYISKKEFGQITVRHLLQHTSGIPYNQRTPAYAPGYHFQYSNGNYEYLYQLIQNVSGMSYREYMQQHVFDPLEMKDTVMRSYINGGSGISSSIRDLSNLAGMLLNGGTFNGKRILFPRSIREMVQPPKHLPVTSSMTYYAHGFRVIVEDGKVTSFYHTGMWNGSFAEMRIFPLENSYMVQLATPESYKSKYLGEFKWKTLYMTQQYIQELRRSQYQPHAHAGNMVH